MGDTCISNIRHFLDEDGMIPVDLPTPAIRLANYFGSIAKAVSSRQDNSKLHTGIKCRRRPGRKPRPRGHPRDNLGYKGARELLT